MGRLLATALLGLVLVGVPAAARADLMNTRPVPVGAPNVGAEKTLQSYLDKTASTINVGTDQTPFALFTTTGDGPSTMTLILEETVFDNTFGIYQFGDPSFRVPVLLADGAPGDVGFYSEVTFDADGVVGRVRVDRFNDKGQFQNSATINGFGSIFGFYIQYSASVPREFFSEDSRNSDDQAHFLGFAGNGDDTGLWYLAQEDSFNLAIDHDYNDYTVSADRIQPLTSLPPANVPEPGSLLLLGAGLIALPVAMRGRIVRKHRSRRS
jgi:hypothetical protein